MNADNTNFGPPPLMTPITAGDGSEFGIPYDQRGTPTGDLHVGWGAWFNALKARIDLAALTVRGTRAGRLALSPTNYPIGTTYAETDTGLTYIDRTTTAVVDTNVLTVNWVSGDQFVAGLVGTQVTINSVGYTVAAFVSATQITLASTAGVQAGVAYSSSMQQWEYLSGTWAADYPSLPGSLLANDIGLQFFDITHWRLFVWAAVGAAPTSTNPGWARGNGEVPTGKIDILPYGGGTTAGMITGWSLCNGGNVSITLDDATTTVVTKPNFASGSFPKGGTTATYGTATAAIPPTITGHTSTATTGITVSAATAATAATGQAESFTGTTVDVLIPPLSGGGGGGAVTDPGHQHNLTAANSPITLPGDPVDNILVPFYMKR